jgi:hypothetical protein
MEFVAENLVASRTRVWTIVDYCFVNDLSVQIVLLRCRRGS